MRNAISAKQRYIKTFNFQLFYDEIILQSTLFLILIFI